MQFVLKAGDSQFNATRPHRGSYSGSLSVVLVEPGRFGRAPPYLTAVPGISRRARWSQCMAWLSPRLVLRSWLMFYVGTFSPQPTTSSCQRANSIVPGIGPMARIVHKDHHSFNYAGKPAHPTAARRGPGRLISPWLKPGALRRNLVNRFQPGWHAEAGNSRSPGDGESDITHPNRQSRGEPIPRPGDGLWRGTDDGIHDRSFPWPRRPINRLYRTTVFRFTPMRRAVSLIPLPSSRCCTIRSIVSAASCDPNGVPLRSENRFLQVRQRSILYWL